MVTTFYLNAEDAEDSGLEPGWYYEYPGIGAPEGPYGDKGSARAAGELACPVGV